MQNEQSSSVPFSPRLAKAYCDSLLFGKPKWTPHPDNRPQLRAYLSAADIIGYGGAAGGGKTDLAVGKALTQHKVTAIFRREGTELTAIEDRISAVLGGTDGYNGQKRIWRLGRGRQIEFGSVPNPGDERKYQGRPKDLLVLDEAANFLEQQVRFLMGWVRTTDPTQHCQVLMTFNPPTTAEGRWIVEFFAPWLDDKHPAPALPGELRWFATIDGRDVEVVSGEPFTHDGELIKPLSRTFIPSRVSDNPYLMGTNYMATLQALPEPLRSQMLYGDFRAGMEDDPWQVIPTEWVEAAQKRWKALDRRPRMDSIGCDVARGGKDNTIIARLHDTNWFDEPLVYPGTQTPDGPIVAGLVIASMRDRAPIHIDADGVGASPYDFLNSNGLQVLGVRNGEGSTVKDHSGLLSFANVRTQLWWQFREGLDPARNHGIALPPDRQLLVDLCAPKWKLQGKNIIVESRDEIIKRIGRSPDWATAYILAWLRSPRASDIKAMNTDEQAAGHDPYAFMGARNSVRREHDPYAR